MGAPLCDVVVWLAADGRTGRLCDRGELRPFLQRELPELPRVGEVAARLAHQAPDGCYWLLITGPGLALLEPRRPSAPSRPPALA